LANQAKWQTSLVQILFVALPIVLVPLLFPWRLRSGFIGVVLGARDGITDVPRTSFGAATRWLLSGTRLLSC
jgi:hypothetical protein